MPPTTPPSSLPTGPTASTASLEGSRFGQCRLDLSDFVDAVRNEPRTLALVRACTWAGGGGCVAGIYLMTTPRYGAGMLLLGIGVILGAAERAPEYAARRWLARTPPAERDLRFTVGDRGLIVASPSSHVLHAWRALEGFHATQRSLLVWISQRVFVILPRRAFAPEELPEIMARFESRVGPPPRSPRLLAGVGLAALAGLAALWAWNRLWPR